MSTWRVGDRVWGFCETFGRDWGLANLGRNWKTLKWHGELKEKIGRSKWTVLWQDGDLMEHNYQELNLLTPEDEEDDGQQVDDDEDFPDEEALSDGEHVFNALQDEDSAPPDEMVVGPAGPKVSWSLCPNGVLMDWRSGLANHPFSLLGLYPAPGTSSITRLDVFLHLFPLPLRTIVDCTNEKAAADHSEGRLDWSVLQEGELLIWLSLFIGAGQRHGGSQDDLWRTDFDGAPDYDLRWILVAICPRPASRRSSVTFQLCHVDQSHP